MFYESIFISDAHQALDTHISIMDINGPIFGYSKIELWLSSVHHVFIISKIRFMVIHVFIFGYLLIDILISQIKKNDRIMDIQK